MNRLRVLLIGALPLFFAYGLWELSRSKSHQAFGEIIARVETTEKIVALTFDDGPKPQFTSEILQILLKENVKATFFLTGNELQKYPEEGRKIALDGHEIGNHSYSHLRMVFVTPSFVQAEIERTDELIRLTGYTGRILFRPPFGKKLFVLPHYLSVTNRKTVTWDVEPEASADVAKDVAGIVEHIVANSRNGSIILLHVMYDRERKSLNSVKPAIEALRKRGFRFATVSELLSIQGN